jgi:hypothetical protein
LHSDVGDKITKLPPELACPDDDDGARLSRVRHAVPFKET